MYFVQPRLLPDVFIFYKNESERKENEKDYYNTMYFGNEPVTVWMYCWSNRQSKLQCFRINRRHIQRKDSS